MKKWKHSPIDAHNPFRLLTTVNAISQYLEHLVDSLPTEEEKPPVKKKAPVKKVVKDITPEED